jgi:hypothetical protein
MEESGQLHAPAALAPGTESETSENHSVLTPLIAGDELHFIEFLIRLAGISFILSKFAA